MRSNRDVLSSGHVGALPAIMKKRTSLRSRFFLQPFLLGALTFTYLQRIYAYIRVLKKYVHPLNVYTLRICQVCLAKQVIRKNTRISRIKSIREEYRRIYAYIRRYSSRILLIREIRVFLRITCFAKHTWQIRNVYTLRGCTYFFNTRIYAYIRWRYVKVNAPKRNGCKKNLDRKEVLFFIMAGKAPTCPELKTSRFDRTNRSVIQSDKVCLVLVCV